MQCEFCGGSIGIEDAYCSHCGQSNKYYSAHRADMDDYEKRFEETKEKISEQVNLFSRRTVFVTTIAVLCMLIFAEILVALNIEDINYSLAKKNDKRNATKLAEQLKEYEKAGDATGFYNYFRQIDYYSTPPIRELLPLENAVNGYISCRNAIFCIVAKEFAYNTVYDIARRIDLGLESIYEFEMNAAEKPDDSRYAKEHIEFVDDMEQELYVYIVAYCDIPMETLLEFPEMKQSQRINLLNESIEKVAADEK